MAKFANAKTKVAPAPKGPLKTKGEARTHEGGKGFKKGTKTELFTLGVTNMVGEDTFYESAGKRDNRFNQLIHQVTREDPQWVAAFLPWLRQAGFMRSAPIVGAAEYVAAGGANGRAVVNSVIQRPDEVAELLGYWISNYGKAMPAAIKRGVADAIKRQYTQRNFLKYDSARNGIRFGDACEMTHPGHNDPTQGALYEHAIDRRHNRDSDIDTIALLPQLAAVYAFNAIPEGERRSVLASGVLPDLITWEYLSGWLPGGMDAAAWEAVIPKMGYMALLRNLRNFENAKVNKSVLQMVADKIADPEEVAKSKQFPFRFWSAYKNSGTMFFGNALEAALELSVDNVPRLPGKTLIAIDTSMSMRSTISEKSKVTHAEIGAVFASVLANVCEKVDVIYYATTSEAIQPVTSVLRSVENINQHIGNVGMGTNTWPEVARHYVDHDRICVFTDGQDHSGGLGTPANVKTFVWDTSGATTTNIDTKNPNKYLLGGFSDAAFRIMGLVEAGANAQWPWEQ